MKKKNKELMEEVIETKLETVLNPEADDEAKRAAFEEAMKAMDRQNELDKVKNQKKDMIIKYAVQGGTFIAGLIVAPIIKAKIDDYFVDKVSKIEEFNTATTSAGRGLFSSLFKFKN